MIDIYTGTPGSGKSLHTVKDIIKRLILRRRVIVNFEMEFPWFLRNRIRKPLVWDNSEVSVENLAEFAKKHHVKDGKGRVKEGQTLVVLDECQLLLDKDFLTADTRKEWKWFFTQHRKMGYDFLLVTQSMDYVDPAVRKVIERETFHFKLENNPSQKMLMLLIWLFCKLIGVTLFVSIQRWVKWDIKMFRRTSFFTYRSWLSNVYNTSNMFET